MAVAADRRAQRRVADEPIREEAPEPGHGKEHQREYIDLIAGVYRKRWHIDADVIGAVRHSDQGNCRGSCIAS